MILSSVLTQAREQETKRALQKQQEQDDKRTEMTNHFFGDFLTENPACAQSAFGSHRVVPDRWKGMSPEQIAEIRRQQDIQRKEAEVCLLDKQSIIHLVCGLS